jgi:outer membrane protein
LAGDWHEIPPPADPAAFLTGTKPMRRSILTACLTLALTGAGPVLAEDLLQIYDLAVQSDPVLKQAEQQLMATREVKPQALSLLLPNIGVGASGQYQNVKAYGLSTPAGTRDREDSFSSGVGSAQLNQTVYNRAQWIGLKQSDDVISQAEAQYRTSQIELMVRTTVAYFEVLRRADAVRVQEALMRANERQLEQSKQRFEVGLVAITDVNESQAAYDSSRANVITAKNILDNSWEALRVIIGNQKVPLARLGDNLPLTPPEPNDIEAWTKAALENNYNIQAASQAVAVAKKQIEIERSGHYPTLGLQAGYDLARSDSDYFGSDTDSAYIGLNLNIPIYQGGAVTSRTRQAGYSLGAAQEQLDQVRRSVIQEVNDAFRGVISSISDVEARKAAIVSATSALESTEAGLEVGTRTQVDVLNAQRNLFQAEFEYLSARYSYIINGVRLYQATSGLTRDVLDRGNSWLNPEDMVTPPSY